MKMIIRAVAVLTLVGAVLVVTAHAVEWPKHMQVVLDETRPLAFDRGVRLPLYLWPALNAGAVDEATATAIVKTLDQRGVGLVSSWSPNPKSRDKNLAEVLTIGRAQTRLGLRVNVNANACLHSFFNGDEQTAHVDEAGERFWDDSFGKGHKMGCPFSLDPRRPEIRERIEFFAQAYKDAGVRLDFVFADWEIDGPIEFNRAHAASKRCVRCREHIANINDFTAFQRSLRVLRSDLQRDCYSQPILARYPDALVGNYAMYPHGGLRYWYDYFEYYVDGQPCVNDQRARYRRWYDDFPGSGYTFAMPVVYTWYPTYGWYDFEDPDYRWFYNMLLVASNAGEHTLADVPIISFVHWHTTAPPEKADRSVKQFSEEKYQELLWHMLLRGTDTFFLWCPAAEAAKEIRLLHAVYAAAQEHGAFLDRGVPVNFAVPNKPAPIVSGLRLGNRVLVRRTDFGDAGGPVELKVGSKRLTIKSAPGRCQVLLLE
jgi:hypothetical protein